MSASPRDVHDKDEPHQKMQSSIPKSSTLQSVSSVVSNRQKCLESVTEKAFEALLRFCLAPVGMYGKCPIALAEEHTRRLISLPIARSTVWADGCVQIAESQLAVINLESKSRGGSSSENMYRNIFAQEFAEILSIMMERLEWTGTTDRTAEAFRTVYSCSSHHRRVYLTRVIFSTPYLEQLQSGKALTEKVVVERSETSLRLDDVEELRELVGHMVKLMRQLCEDFRDGLLSKQK